MTLDEVLQVARLGASQGCAEALFTLGDQPEARWPEARAELEAMGYGSTLEYVEAAARAVYRTTGLLPHINAGVMDEADVRRLKQVSVSQGLMLESTCEELLRPGGPHAGCPDKHPAVRLATIEAAGRAAVPFTSGILVGIGDTRAHRLHALACLHALHARYGHIQELIIQNFRAKPGTAMATAPEPALEELLWAVAAARIIFGPNMSIQVPPNLTPFELPEGVKEDDSGSFAAAHMAALQEGWRSLLDAGVNDWGGISPITRDFVNPERPWPHLQPLAEATAAAGKLLLPRLPVYPSYLGLLASREPPSASTQARSGSTASGRGNEEVVGSSNSSPTDGGSSWLDFSGGRDSVGASALRCADSEGLLRASAWVAGGAEELGPSGGQAPAAQARAPHEPPPAQQPLHQQQKQGQGQQPSAVRGHALQSSVPLPRGPREDRSWAVAVGVDGAMEGFARQPDPSQVVTRLLEGVLVHGRPLQQLDVERLLRSRGADHAAVVAAADELRRRVCGDSVSYVVNRNIQYTNICSYRCAFCAFSHGRAAEKLRGPAFLVPYEEVERRTAEAWERGATEVCMQGGIAPDFTGDTYLRILAAAKSAAPRMHVHAFSPLEVHHGATTLGLTYERYLERLAAAGLGSLPGTAAEVLDDSVRRVLCPDKLSTHEWFEVVAAAHRVGLRTTSTLMFGSVEDGPAAWATHLVGLREAQQRAEAAAAGSAAARNGVGFSEFVPLPFVHMEAPVYVQGRARRGPSLHECVLLHAVARLALHPHIHNIQASWVKMGPDRAAQLLASGCNDMGGSIMNESISRIAGASHGQELPPQRMEEIIRAAGRQPRQRTTLYGAPPPEQTARSYHAAALAPLVTAPPASGALR